MDDELIEARNYLEKLLSKGWFRHAVGDKGVKYLTTILKFVELQYKECSVNVDLNALTELLDEYYSAEIKVRYYIRELLRVQGNTVDLIRRIYPLLSPDVKEVFDKALRNTPQDAPDDVLINNIINALIQEMDIFKNRLIEYINMVKESCAKQAYNQTS